MMIDNFEKQLNEIRVKMYEETKHMTPAERADFHNERGRHIAEKYGITITQAPGRPPAPKASGE